MARTLPQAAFARKTDEVRKLLEGGTPVDETDQDGRSALHCAVMVNELAIVELLLAAGARADLADSVGDVPLHFAAQHPVRLPVLKLLLDRAPNVVNKAGGAGRTPLAVAVDAKFVEGIKLLLQRGADPTLKDMAGLSPIDRAPNAKIKALLVGDESTAKPATPKKKSARTKVDTAPETKSSSTTAGPLSSIDAWERASTAERSAAVKTVLPTGFMVIGACGDLELVEVSHAASGTRFVVIPAGRYLAGPGERDREAMEALEVDEGLLEGMDAFQQRDVVVPPMLFARHPKLDERAHPVECSKKQAAAVAAEFAKNGLRLPTEDEWEWVARTCDRTVFVGSASADDAEENCANLADDFSFDPNGDAGSPLGVWGLLFGEWVGDKTSGAPIGGVSGAAQNYPFQDSDGLAGCLACIGVRPAKGEKLAVRAVKTL
jgi:hypothetical protein